MQAVRTFALVLVSKCFDVCEVVVGEHVVQVLVPLVVARIILIDVMPVSIAVILTATTLGGDDGGGSFGPLVPGNLGYAPHLVSQVVAVVESGDVVAAPLNCLDLRDEYIIRGSCFVDLSVDDLVVLRERRALGVEGEGDVFPRSFRAVVILNRGRARGTARGFSQAKVVADLLPIVYIFHHRRAVERRGRPVIIHLNRRRLDVRFRTGVVPQERDEPEPLRDHEHRVEGQEDRFGRN